MKKTFLRFALMSIVVAGTMVACNKDDDKKNTDDNTQTEEQTATQAQTDAFTFLLCSNTAYETAGQNVESAEYQQAIGACLQNSLTVASLSFDAEGKPNNTYTTELYTAITETVTTMYTGQTAEAIATSIGGIQYMIYSFYQSLQSGQ